MSQQYIVFTGAKTKSLHCLKEFISFIPKSWNIIPSLFSDFVRRKHSSESTLRNYEHLIQNYNTVKILCSVPLVAAPKKSLPDVGLNLAMEGMERGKCTRRKFLLRYNMLFTRNSIQPPISSVGGEGGNSSKKHLFKKRSCCHLMTLERPANIWAYNLACDQHITQLSWTCICWALGSKT